MTNTQESPQSTFEERIVPGRFDGKCVIVTGSGSGIGRSSALRIAREGGRVIATDVSTPRLEQLTSEHPELDLVPVSGDVSNADHVDSVMAAAGESIDGLANVAGIMDEFHPVHEVPDEVWERVLRINLTGTMLMMRACVAKMLPRERGSVVNVASEAALRGSAAGVAYTASKHAVIGVTKNSAVMYSHHGIRVNAVVPGGVATGIQAHFTSVHGAQRLGPLMQSNLPLVAQPEELAAIITYLLSDDSPNITGAVVASDGGWSAI